MIGFVFIISSFYPHHPLVPQVHVPVAVLRFGGFVALFVFLRRIAEIGPRGGGIGPQECFHGQHTVVAAVLRCPGTRYLFYPCQRFGRPSTVHASLVFYPIDIAPEEVPVVSVFNLIDANGYLVEIDIITR